MPILAMAATHFLRLGGDWKDITSFRIVLASPAPTEGSDQPNGDRFARRLPLDPAKTAAAPWMESVDSEYRAPYGLCTSDVQGFEQLGRDFGAELAAQGMRLVDSTEF